MCVCTVWPQKEPKEQTAEAKTEEQKTAEAKTEEQKTAEAKTEEQETKGKEQKPKVRPAPPHPLR